MRSTIRNTVSTLLGILVFSSTGVAQTDGITTTELVPAGIPTYPGLPPNSADIVYDDGNFTGGSRNIQNAGIHSGWTYWAHQVEFTQTANMQGELLEVRYVASSQWGATANFDLVIRDSAGAVISSLPGNTAVMDSGNWQVIDVSSLDFVPANHGSSFFVELQPSNQCAGTNGFTIAYSTPSSGESSTSADCTNPASSFNPEGRNLFIRAVVELGPSNNAGNAYCFGDGTGAICPCSGFGALGEGCTNTSGSGGATLTASGSASLTNDTLSLSIIGVPGNKPGLVLRGANMVNGGLGNPAGDGLLCTSGNTARSHVQITSAGSTQFSNFNGSSFGAVSYGVGVPTNYQFWYRDATNPCSGSGFNFSNAWTVTWTP